ncbi:hypothetical protein AAVH_35964, partial [Aphelenchoides avenae]
MLRVRLRVLLLVTAHLVLMRADKSHSEETSSISGRDTVKTASCGKDFAPTATVTATEDDLFGFWDNKKAEQLEAYSKIVPYLKANLNRTRTKPDEPLFFPAHLPLVEKRYGSDVLVLKDVYVRAEGRCGDISEGNYPDGTKPAWFMNRPERLQKDVEMLEAYVERMPRSHWGYRVPKVGENDVCLDDTGLVVKDLPGIRTCFSMWIIDDVYETPKHFAGRQIYNRINQELFLNISEIGFHPSGSDSIVKPVSTDFFSLSALFLKDICYVTNELRENRCTYWAATRFYVSLCCCYTNRTECAYRTYKFPSQKKPADPALLACATGTYYVLKSFGGNRQPQNASEIKEFVRERTSSEFCKWTYTWNPSNETNLEDVLRVDLDTEHPTAIDENMRNCTLYPDEPCCQRTTTLCPLDANSTVNEIRVECFCSDGDLCNKRRSYVEEDLARNFKEAPPCETHTLYEHLLGQERDAYKKPDSEPIEGFMCPVFYNFAHPGRPNAFLQLLFENNFGFLEPADYELFEEHGCHLVEVNIREMGDCPEKLFENHDHKLVKSVLILLCSVEGNPLGERRTSYPDAELKKTIEVNLTDAKAEYPKCKTDFRSMDFASLSKLVVDNSKLFDMYDDRKNGTNDNTTTPYCYVEVSLVYQQQYNFTFGEVPIDDTPLRANCIESVPNDVEQPACVPRNSTADDGHQRFACCCARHWSKPQDMCRKILVEALKPLLNENVIAKQPEEIMSELKEDPLTKCVQPERSNKAHDRTDVNRPCAGNEGCYTAVHARDVPTSTQHKE